MPNLCHLNKNTMDICLNQHLWKNKLEKYTFITEYPKDLHTLLRLYHQLEVAENKAIDLVNKITILFEEYNNGQYHYHAFYKMWLIRLVYEINDINKNMSKKIKKYFGKYSAPYEFRINQKEPLQTLLLNDLKIMVVNILTESLYLQDINMTDRKIKKIYSYIYKYMVANYKI